MTAASQPAWQTREDDVIGGEAVESRRACLICRLRTFAREATSLVVRPAVWIVCSQLVAVLTTSASHASQPNILWLTSEDHGPHLGCYGDTYAETPHVDRLAQKGLRYTRVWSNAPVCAPARTVLISGLHGPSAGAEHMRSAIAWPRDRPVYTRLLRDAGYYCTNNVKTDYNLTPPEDPWDESSETAHWRNRPSGQPFFAIFNSTKSHESQVRRRPHTLQHDPARAPVPPYHPDTPETRRDWAQYYDAVTAADADAGARLAELETDGLLEDTIIFFYADHGAGLPRSKRWPYNSGLLVPLVVYIPEKFQHLRPPDYAAGGTSDRLVSFVDFAPTVLSLAGIEPPAWLQGQAFLGATIAPPPQFLHGFRGRMDERIDLVRATTDGRFVYIRNYFPHRIQGQHIDYLFEMPTAQVWRAQYEAGLLNDVQSAFWRPKPPEELYDLATDPHEIRNLATSAEHAAMRNRLRAAQRAHALEIRDLGFLPEGELFTRAPGSPPYDFARDPAVYPVDRVIAAAERATLIEPGDTEAVIAGTRDEDSAVRFWSVLGLHQRGTGGEILREALRDPSPYVAIAAAEALVAWDDDTAPEALKLLGDYANPATQDVFISLAALNSLGALGDKARPLASLLATYDPSAEKLPDQRYAGYIAGLLKHLRATLTSATAVETS